MSLTAGTRFGPYEVGGAIGAGGMGEVYRARDTKLNRDVALKILSEAFASDPERLARFDREAKTLASLNHPNIAQIYGFEESGPIHALVMELVPGEDLADRIARGAIPLDEALPIAQQIAEALEAAHELGIIHRDLKPANVRVRRNGTVKVLDFGLAKAPDRKSTTDGESGELLGSSTITAAMTMPGVILGTAAYMAPEQAKGHSADRRADIWAFGCVLYEMLTGQRAFAGRDLSETLVSVLSKDVDWSALPRETPGQIRSLLRRCLQRSLKERLRDIGDAHLQIRDAINSPEVVVGAAKRSRLASVAPWAVAAAAILAALGLAVAAWRRPASPAAMRLSVELGSDMSLASGTGNVAILSPDGSVLAFVAQKGVGGASQLYVRRLDQLQATPLAGTDAAEGPFFSPDGQWIGFFAGGKLKKIAVAGSAVVVLCDVADHRGGAWAEDGTIVFSYAGPGVSLQRVSSTGGMPETLTSLAEGEVTHRWPQVLPGGTGVLYTASGSSDIYDAAIIVVQPLPAGERKIVLRGGSHGRYSPSGHLVYGRHGTLFASAFDLDRLEVTGEPMPVLDGVKSDATTGDAQFAMSAGGTLVYLPGQSTGSGAPIHWMDQAGMSIPLRVTPTNWFYPRFAPDGRRLAVNIFQAQSTIWVYEWARDRLAQVTSADDFRPVWSPDGRSIAFGSRVGTSPPNLYWRRADGTGESQRLTESKSLQLPASWHPSGRFIAFFELTSANNDDLMILPLEGDAVSGWKAGKATVFLPGPSRERDPTFSPDGRWLAYTSNESGRQEVWVRPFPGPGGKWLVSTAGGEYPTWSHTRRELFYGNHGQIMVVQYVVQGDSFSAEKPRLWSNGRYLTDRGFDLHPDGNRLALASAAQGHDGAKPAAVVLILNFFDELRRIAPVKR